MQLLAGQIIDGKYRIIARIGQGGMGEVYRGEHIRIGRQVAIKVLYPECAQDLTLARFEREARAAARIGNDHILEVLDFGSLPDKAPYLVAELLEGETLEQRLAARHRLASAEAVALVIQLLDGLAAAHRADVLHRDLKPANVFLLSERAGRRDFVKIIDFGVSKFLSVSNDGLCVTATGALVGTPYYLAPELTESSHSADARCDLYAVGVILYEMITGRPPFEAENLTALMIKIVTGTARPPEQLVPELDPQLASLIKRAIARHPAERFSSAGEFTSALSAWALSAGARPSFLPAPLPPEAAHIRPSKTELLAPPVVHHAEASVPPRGAPTPSGFEYARPSRSWAIRRSLWALASALGVLGIGALVVTLALSRHRGPAHSSATAGPGYPSSMPPVPSRRLEASSIAVTAAAAPPPRGGNSARTSPETAARTRLGGTRPSSVGSAAPSGVRPPVVPSIPPPVSNDPGAGDFGY